MAKTTSSSKPRTFKQRQADRGRMVRHAEPFAWFPEGRRFNYGTGRTACGKSIHGAQSRLITMGGAGVPTVTCTPCRKLLDMTAIQFDQHVTTEVAKLAQVRVQQQAKAAAVREQKQRDGWDVVHKYEDDALVALDAFLSDTYYEHMDEVLRAAVLKHRLMFPATRGEKLYVMGGTLHEEKRTVVCRFCRKQVGRGDLGKDHSRSWFDTHSWREFAYYESYQSVYGDSPSYVCVGRHTTLCALAYLSGTECVELVPG